MTEGSDVLVVGVVVAARLLLPLLIFRFPLPGILACLVLDGLDQTIFQQYTSLELSGYQGYDKALDIYYLSLAYAATMRNWVDGTAFAVARFLFYYRLVGVAAFEIADGEPSALLLIFPNTFEFFFILYELVRTRWNPRRLSARSWILAAAGIWIFVKLPQEYWIHIAKLDTTELLGDNPWIGVAAAAAIVAVLAVFWLVIRPRLAPVDHGVTLEAGPPPPSLATLAQRLAYRASRGHVGVWLLEKVVLISVVCVIFVQILPGTEASVLQMSLVVAGLVVVNSALGLLSARRGRGFDSVAISFFALSGVNAVIVIVLRELRQAENEFPVAIALFFVLLLSLIVTVFDRYRPLVAARMAE